MQTTNYRTCTYPRLSLIHKLGISPAMKRGLRDAAVTADIMHTNGLWMMPNVYPSRVIDRRRTVLVLSPRGTMDSWAWRHHRWRKRVVWLAGQAQTVRAAACFHATAEEEAACVRDLGFRAPVAVVPNGVTIPDLTTIPERHMPGRTLLFLARIHEKKGVDILLRAWRNVQEQFRDWNLLIVGPDDGGYLPKMKQLAARLATRRLSFVGRIPESDKSAYFRSAELYVLPTHAENWGMSIAEALAHGIPAIVGRGAPWSGLESRDCGWWIQNDVGTLTETLRTALALSPDDLAARGARGRKWVGQSFAWERMAEMMRDTYLWLLGRGPRPPCVQI